MYFNRETREKFVIYRMEWVTWLNETERCFTHNIRLFGSNSMWLFTVAITLTSMEIGKRFLWKCKAARLGDHLGKGKVQGGHLRGSLSGFALKRSWEEYSCVPTTLQQCPGLDRKDICENPLQVSVTTSKCHRFLGPHWNCPKLGHILSCVNAQFSGGQVYSSFGWNYRSLRWGWISPTLLHTLINSAHWPLGPYFFLSRLQPQNQTGYVWKI